MNPGKPRILVVDDNKKNVELLEAHLISGGYGVEVAYDGREALTKIFDRPPELILLDIMMPQIDGYEVCQKVKENDSTKFIPVIMITALTEMEDKIRAIEVGADDFMNKPFNKVELFARVRSLLRIKHLNDQLERSYQEIELKNQVLFKILNRYVAGEIVEKLLEDPQKHLVLGGEDKVVTTLFADIQGFTNFANKNPAQKVVSILNDCFSEMTRTIFRHKGTFDKYMGDSIMAFFGAPIKRGDDTIRTLKTAVEMQESFKVVKERWNDKDFNQLGLGIGINTGKAVVGNIGSEKVMDYTVIGSSVNIARRLQEYAPENSIIMSESTYLEVKDMVAVKKIPSISLKGIKKDTIVYQLQKIL